MANSVPGRIAAISLTIIIIIIAVHAVKENDFDKFTPLFNYQNVEKRCCFSECTTLQSAPRVRLLINKESEVSLCF